MAYIPYAVQNLGKLINTLNALIYCTRRALYCPHIVTEKSIDFFTRGTAPHAQQMLSGPQIVHTSVTTLGTIPIEQSDYSFVY